MKIPTLLDVQLYCKGRNNGIDAQHFLDYYEQVGWKVGKLKKPMVSWEAAIRTWERNQPAKPKSLMERITDRSWAD